MDPVSEEYFYTIEVVKKELESFRQNNLKEKILSLYQKNKILINELRESTFRRDLSGNDNERLSLAIAAKETAILLWQEAMQQLENLEEQLIGRRSLVETEGKEFAIGIGQIKEQYQKGMMTLSAELSNFRSSLSDIKQKLENKSFELEEKKVEFKKIKEDFLSSQAELSVLSLKNVELQEKLSSLQQALDGKSNLLSITEKELDKVNSVNDELSSVAADLKEQNKKLKYDLSVLEKDAKESLFAAQEAILQKKEITYKEEQYIKDIEMLRSSGGIDVQRVELRCNQKIHEIQELNSERVKSLMAEIEELHNENGVKQSLFEKAEREKKALESKLELLSAETSNSFPGTVLDDLCNRLVSAEKARDECELQVKSLQSDLDEMKSNKEQEAKRYAEEKNILKERLVNVSKEFHQFLSDKLKLNEELCSVQKKCQELEKELTFKRARQAQEITAVKSEADRTRESFDEMLHLVEQHYKTVCKELHTLLESQFKINKRWKTESEELISKFESKVIELCDTIAQLQYQNTELVAALQQNSSYRQNNHSFNGS
ncbi:sodium channel and clathrin linker 1 [Parasteatoda tepidariorum]|nr:GRIP and coiled-coil domain-containing protein 2 [Parasteatoda tepidariorum]